MAERPMTPEMQVVPPEAVTEVAKLYVDNLLNFLRDILLNSSKPQSLELQSIEERDQIWEKVVQKFIPFADEISRLRGALKASDKAKITYSSSMIFETLFSFKIVKDLWAQFLLSDLLIARITTSEGHIDDSRIAKEAEIMALELGVEGGLQGDKMKSLTINDVVEAILSGKLKLPTNAQLEKK